MSFFLYHSTTAPTGRVLASALGIPGGTTPPSERQDVLIRWGSQARVAFRPEFTVNPAFAIARATDKFASLQIMQERGVVVPQFSTDPNGCDPPFLGRRFQHTRGQDIVLYLQRADVAREPRDFYVEYVPTVREYRARVVGDRCVRVSEKIATEGAELCPYIRNYEHGYTFRQPRTPFNDFQQALAIAAVKTHGLHFGAVDLVVGEDGNTYVLEVNTAPSLAPMSAAAMLAGIVELINTETGVELYADLQALAALSENAVDMDGDTEDDDERGWF
jgi:hypothetical protein